MDPPKQQPKKQQLLDLTGGNATGTGRTKVFLKPGYGLMGWVKFAEKAKDLSGLNGAKPRNDITNEELKQHDKPDNCWLAIRGKVYNVSAYLDYHPGGWDELMKGAGKDATELFEEAHSWVNYENLLEKCLVGTLANNL